MKTITLTSNEALVLIAEGMTMNNVKSLANKLRNADAPVAATNTQFTQYDNEVVKQNLKLANQQVYDYERALEKTKAQSKTWEQSYHDAMANLEKAKQTESTLRKALAEEGERLSRMTSKIRDLENDARQDAESLTYFRKWVEGLRVATDADKGLATAGVFSQAIEMIKESNRLGDRVVDLESKLNKANDVIAAVKLAYDHEGWTLHKAICEISDTVEAYYRGN